MISRYTYHGLTWIDLESPSREELLHISEEFNLAKPVEEELFSPTVRSKIDSYDNFIYLVLHFPQEINFIIGKHFILTIRYEIIEPLHHFATLFENVESHDQGKKVANSNALFLEMMKHMYNASLTEMKEIASRVPELEKNIFNNKEDMVLKIISQTNHRLLNFKRSFSSHREVLHSYELVCKQFFGDSAGFYAIAIMSEFNKFDLAFRGYRLRLKDIQNTNDSLLAIRTNTLLKNCLYAIIIGIVLIVISIFLWH